MPQDIVASQKVVPRRDLDDILARKHDSLDKHTTFSLLLATPEHIFYVRTHEFGLRLWTREECLCFQNFRKSHSVSESKRSAFARVW